MLCLAYFGCLSATAFAQTMPVVRFPGSDAPTSVRPGGSILPTAHTSLTSSKDRPLPPQILAMPQIDEELELIEGRSQLIVTRDRITRVDIASPEIVQFVQYSPTEVAILGGNRGSTTVTFWFEGSNDPLIYLIQTIRDPNLEYQRRVDYGRLEEKLKVIFPNSKVYLIPMSRKLVVKGQARDSAEAALIMQIVRGEIVNQYGNLAGPQPIAPSDIDVAVNPYDLASGYIVNMLQVPGEHMLTLRVRVAELNRSQLKRLGVDIAALINDGRHLISSSIAANAPTLTGIFENGEISFLIDALASNGTAKILDEPNLTVLSGRQASFLSGGEFAVPTIVGIGGAQGQATTFRGFGTSLIVTPTLLDRDMVRLAVTSEYSEINQGNAVGGIPGTDARRVNTTVEMREGQTLALAGLISHRTSTEVSRIPFLGDIPVVGTTLFSSKQSTQDENELLILITPEIVRPMDPEEVPPPPGFEVTPPNDQEFYKYNMTEGAPDIGVYQAAPYGANSMGTDVGYRLYAPGPASPHYAPVPGNGAIPPQMNYQPGMETAPQGMSYPGTMPQPVMPAPQYPQSQPTPQALPPAPAVETGANNAADSRFRALFGNSGPAIRRQQVQQTNYSPRAAVRRQQ